MKKRRTNEVQDEGINGLCRMVGQCPEMLEVFATIRKVATSDAPVLILGESGTGKELVAQAIYSMSLRKHGPFIPINVGAIPESLLESELFGHEKGAFTGAQFQVQGKVEYAHNGTLFLDEIGELPPKLQVKLLRFLQDSTIQRVGGREDIPVDIRIIAATNVHISKAIEKGHFREDLYYRIGVICINLPPLRERGDDILMLANFFLCKFAGKLGKDINQFSESAKELLSSHHWPGNVRELENKILRAVIMAESSTIQPHDLEIRKRPTASKFRFLKGKTLKDARDEVECYLVHTTIENNKGNLAMAAKALGISRPTLYHLIRKHALHFK